MQRIKLRPRPDPAILLDCGAYSAFTQGTSIKLDQYIAYVKHNRHLVDCYLNLDVIPGSDGRREWKVEHIERAAKQSHENQLRMKAAGLSPIPVFHRGESFKWLKRMLRDGENYIALAPLPWGVHRHEIMHWLNDCFMRLTDRGRPLVKVHGLGVTSLLICRSYPFFSVDSTTWFKSGALGHIPVPIYVDDRPDYRLSPTVVTMTDRSRHGRNHIDELIGYDFDRVRRYLNEQVGIDIEHARYGHRHRQAVWVNYFQGLEASCSTRIVFVTDTSRRLTEVLTRSQARHRLLSYFKLKEQRDDALADYVAGRMRPPTTRPRRPALWSPRDCDERRLALYEHLSEQRRSK